MRLMQSGLVVTLVAAALGLAACGERPQTATHRKADGHPYDGPATDYSAAGWKAGDAVSWETQMRTRAQSQNEYARANMP